MRIAPALACLCLLAACQDRPEATSASPAASPGTVGGEPVDDWRRIASADDASRLGRLHQAWRLARAEVEERGFSPQVEALGPLVDPNAGLVGRLQPAPGAYRCRMLALGTQEPGQDAYVEGPWIGCRIDLSPGGDLSLTSVSGSQRAHGLLYPDSERRLVFVGLWTDATEEPARAVYGSDPQRDRIGSFERIGPERWRLATPWPRTGGKLELLELRR